MIEIFNIPFFCIVNCCLISFLSVRFVRCLQAKLDVIELISSLPAAVKLRQTDT